MKTQSPLWLANALAVLALAAPAASAQPEQWLKYAIASEPKAYRWIEVSTNAPQNIKLPELQAPALFGCWSNSLDPKGRWFALDRTAKTGLQNRLFFDRNGNGRLDDETPVSTTTRDVTSAGFSPIKLVFKGDDGPLSYHVVPQLYVWEPDRIQLLLGSACWYEGTVNFDGKKQRIQLIDENVNGVFNDVGDAARGSDRISFVGDEVNDRSLGKYLELDQKLLAVDVARDGAFIKVKPAEGVRFGKIRVSPDIREVTAIGQMGHFVRKVENGEFDLPVGGYRMQGWKLDRKDDQGATWTLMGYGLGKSADFTVQPDTPVALAPGEPIRCQLSATETKGQVAFSLRMVGNLGESVEVLKGKDRPRAPQLLLASKDGTFGATNTFEYG